MQHAELAQVLGLLDDEVPRSVVDDDVPGQQRLVVGVALPDVLGHDRIRDDVDERARPGGVQVPVEDVADVVLHVEYADGVDDGYEAAALSRHVLGEEDAPAEGSDLDREEERGRDREGPLPPHDHARCDETVEVRHGCAHRVARYVVPVDDGVAPGAQSLPLALVVVLLLAVGGRRAGGGRD